MHKEPSKEIDAICGSDTISIPALTGSSHSNHSTMSRTNQRQLPGLVASSCSSYSSQSIMDDVDAIQSLMCASCKGEPRASRTRSKKIQNQSRVPNTSYSSSSSQDDSEQDGWDDFQHNYLNFPLVVDLDQNSQNKNQDKQHTSDDKPVFRICNAVHNFSSIPSDKEINCSDGSLWCPTAKNITTDQISLAL